MAKKRIRNKDLAEALDITENSIYRLRRTDEMPRLTPERLDGICAALKCQPGDLLAWVPDKSSLLQQIADSEELREPVSSPSAPQQVTKQVLNNLTEFCDQISALAWEGYIKYGLGAVVYTEKADGPEIAYIERSHLSDPDCLEAIDDNRPESSVVILYYQDSDLDGDNYSILTLSGPKTPPECYALLS